MEWGFWIQGSPCDPDAFQCPSCLFWFTSLWSWQDPWKVPCLWVHDSFTTCTGLSVRNDSNQSLVSFFLTCRSVWMSWWIVPFWKAAWGHPEFKHTLWEPKMIKYSKSGPLTDWLNLFQDCRCGDRNDSAVWLSIPCLSLRSNIIVCSLTKMILAYQDRGWEGDFISEAVTDKDASRVYKRQEPVRVFVRVCMHVCVCACMCVFSSFSDDSSMFHRLHIPHTLTPALWFLEFGCQ